MFKDIENYEGMYQVNEFGEVKALHREVINKKGNIQYYPEKLLKPELTAAGYLRVTLSKNTKTKRFSVHRLVAQTFIVNTYNKDCVNHIDNNPSNNNISNLEWCTHSENMLHAQKQNRLFSAQSKGGKTRGISGVIADKKMNDMLNKIFLPWKVTTFSHKRGKKKYFNVVCTVCGNTTTREQSYLKHSNSTHCIKCSKRG
jgi:hypothetical protein